MHFTTISVAVAFASTALAAPSVAPRQDALQPFSLNTTTIFSPSGRPGQYPWSQFTANVSDPNALTVGTNPNTNESVVVAPSNGLNCVAKYLGSEGPYDRSWPCDNEGTGEGYWVMKIAQVAGNDSGYNVTFTHLADTLVQGREYKKIYEGSIVLKVGDNLQGQCGGSGVCNWALKGAPLAIVQSEVA